MKHKIIISFVITIFLISFMGLWSINKMDDLSGLTQDLYDHPLSVTNATKTIQSHIISMHRYMKDVVLSKNEDEFKTALTHVNKSEKIVYKEFEKVFERYLGDRADIQKSYDAFVDWKPIRAEIITLVSLGKKVEAADITKAKGAEHVKMLNDQVSIMIDYAQNKAAYFLNNSNEIKKESIYMTSALVILILFIITTILVLLLNNLKKSQQDMKKQNALLLQQSRLAQMGDMISMIAHQWRQPLATISSTSIDLQINLQLSTFDLKDENGRKNCEEYFNESLKNIDSLVQNLTTTIDDFRNFYKPNKLSTLVFVKIPIAKSLKVIRKSLETDSIVIVENYQASKEIELFESEFIQVILNILKNAQDNFKEKYTQNPQIEITTSDTMDGVMLSIKDNGGGIDSEILPNIFDPYFSTKSDKNGTGLGLYMSKIIIENHHNGKLNVYSEDGFTHFNIYLNSNLQK